mgnify:CR=1 FL=1
MKHKKAVRKLIFFYGQLSYFLFIILFFVILIRNDVALYVHVPHENVYTFLRTSTEN